MRARCCFALAPFEILDVLLVVALEPHHLRVTLEGEYVGRNAIQKPAVVGDHHGAAREAHERLLECAQRLNIEIVSRLIEK